MSEMTNERPWGSYIVLSCTPSYQIKQITVKPGQRLSYQIHNQRSEHWFIIQGEAGVTKDYIDYVLRNGNSINIPIGCAHRIANKGVEPLVFIEIQTGTYFGEDDIIRLEDDYGRV